MAKQSLALTKEWYRELEKSASSDFVLLPLELQARGWNYNEIAEHWLNFFKDDSAKRRDKLRLARKFSKFISIINKNRAKVELGEAFFECFHYFMENFSDLMEKQDWIQLDALEIISEGLDKTRFIEDVISLDELKIRAKRILKVEAKEKIIDVEWKDVQIEYKKLNPDESKKRDAPKSLRRVLFAHREHESTK
jgi:hypothetical protein